jgi:hypothetical protein
MCRKDRDAKKPRKNHAELERSNLAQLGATMRKVEKSNVKTMRDVVASSAFFCRR